jgi:hypothetical protein
MNREYSALDLQCLNDRPSRSSVWNEVSARDCLAVVVVLGLAAGWGVDRWQTLRFQSASSAALAEARAALDEARQEALREAQELRGEQESLVARLWEEKEATGKLRSKIAALEAELRPGQEVRYAVGRER